MKHYMLITIIIGIVFLLGTAVSQTPVQVTIETVIDLTTSIDLPDWITLEFKRGGAVRVNGASLTIRGDVKAGPWEIFEFRNGGTVQLLSKNIIEIYPQWWAGTNTFSLTESFSTGVTTGAKVVLPTGTYLLDNPIDVPLPGTSHLTIEGHGNAVILSKVPEPSTVTAALSFTGTGSGRLVLRNLYFEHSSTMRGNLLGIKGTDLGRVLLSNVRVHGFFIKRYFVFWI